jgi:2-polyprenyl-3-methyl-5-hydroxy-6-metoxy-1,4-benzoquinol methylase
MSTDKDSEGVDALNRETRHIWDRNAAWWDKQTGEGNQFQQVLIGPATERLLGLRAGEMVLDIACGNGAFSTRMAQMGAKVVALDFSERFLERAKARTKEHVDRIEYKLIDATDEAQLLALGTRGFDAAVCTMALMDMVTIEPLVSALSQLLKAGGRFVFSVLHPCFNSSEGIRLVAEQEDRDGELMTLYSVKVSRYVRPSTWKGVGIPGQPTAQNYFHRPLSVLLGACFRAGFVLDGLEEPVFGEAVRAAGTVGWANFREIPPVLVARVRLVSGQAA